MKARNTILVFLALSVISAHGSSGSSANSLVTACLSQAGNANEVISNCSLAIAKYPAKAKLYYFRGMYFREIGYNNKALEDFDESVRLDPDDKGVLQERGRALEEEGRFEEALSDYKAFYQRYSNHGEAKADIARLTKQLGTTSKKDPELNTNVAASRPPPPSPSSALETTPVPQQEAADVPRRRTTANSTSFPNARPGCILRETGEPIWCPGMGDNEKIAAGSGAIPPSPSGTDPQYSKGGQVKTVSLSLPRIDIENQCSGYMKTRLPNGRLVLDPVKAEEIVGECIAEQQKAYDELKILWSTLSVDDRFDCHSGSDYSFILRCVKSIQQRRTEQNLIDNSVERSKQSHRFKY